MRNVMTRVKAVFTRMFTRASQGGA